MTINRLLILAAIAVVGPAALAQTSNHSRLSSKEAAQGYRDGYVLAKPRADHMGMVDAAEAREGLVMQKKFARFGSLRLLRLGAGDTTKAAVRRLAATGRYEFVEPDYLRYTTSIPTDPDFPLQWALNNTGSNGPGVGIAGDDIHAVAAWNTINSAPNVIVAIIDTGVDNTHPDLKGNLWQNPQVNNDGYSNDLYGINVSTTNDGNGNTTDDDGHGTHVAGIIGAVEGNGLDTAGVAWSVQIMALKLFGSSGSALVTPAFVSDEVACINFAISHGANVINASFGGPVYSSSEYTAIKGAQTSNGGIILVAAAGNNTTNNDLAPFYPASYPLDNIVAVGASDDRDDSAYFTNYGCGIVDLSAPGTNIISLSNTSGTISLSGTSMSAPFVSGSLALLKAEFPSDTYRQLINRILNSVDTKANFTGRTQTGGRLNLAGAVTSTSNRPFNDNFSQRAHLAGSNIAVRSNNAGATLEIGEPTVGGNTGGASLWWDWTAPITGTVNIATTGSAYATVVAVYTGTSLTALTPVASNDSAGTGASNVSFTAQAGTTYEITVDGQSGASGFTLLNLNYGNDSFASAATLTGTSVGITAGNMNATREPGEPEILGNLGGHSLWYAWTAPESRQFQISVFSPSFDPLLAIYTGSALASLSLVSANMGQNILASSGPTTPASLCSCTFNATAGTTYYITVDGNITADSYTGFNTGQFTLSIADSRWQAPTYDSITCAPTVGSDGSVYVCTTGGSDGAVYAFNADGSTKWGPNTAGGPLDGTSMALSSDGTTLYVVAPQNGVAKCYLFAINTSDGSLKWRNLIVTAQSVCSPTVASDGTIYVKDQASTLYAFNPDSSIKWMYSVSGASTSSPVIAPDGTIYIGSDNGSLYAINSGGTAKWTFTPANASSNPICTTAAIDTTGNIYFGTLGGMFYAVNSSGQQIWSFPAGGCITSSPALDAGGNVYFGCYDRNLYSLNTANGAQNWTYTTGGEIRGSSPVIDSNGVIYVGSLDGNVYAINSTGTLDRIFATGFTGSLNRIYGTGDGLSSSPAIFGTTLYFGSTDHKLYAFDIGASSAGSAWPMYLYNSRRVGRAVTDPLAITAQSSGPVSLNAGQSLTLTVAATGEGPLSFQWKLNGVAITGATNAAYVVPSAGTGNSGVYTAVVSGPQGSMTSSPVTVTVISLTPTFTLAASPSSVTVASGRSVAFNAIATGVPAPTYQWTLNGSTTIPGASGTTDSVLLVTGATVADAGTYMCTATNSQGSVSTSATLTVTTTSSPGYLTNLSSRVAVGTGGNILIAGFAIAGSGSMDLLLRGVGPALIPAPFGVSGALSNTQMTQYDTVNPNNPLPIVTNSGWSNAFTLGTSTVNVHPQAATLALMNTLGAFTLNWSVGSLDSALEVTPPVSSYTVQISGVGGATGVALAEVYDVDAYTPSTRLVNLSTRAQVGTGANILIGGFTIGGSTSETLLVRGVGPTLGAFGVPGTIVQPSLSIFTGSTQLYTNTGWASDTTIAGVFGTVGAFNLASSSDCVLLVTLPPGGYTAQVSGVSNTTGVALVEIYDVF